MALLEGIAGLSPGKISGGVTAPVGMSQFSRGILIAETCGRYAEAVANGELFTLSSALVATPAAGPLAAGGTPMLALWNPINSGYVAFVKRIGVITTATGTVSPKGYEIDTGPLVVPITQATVTAPLRNDCSGVTDTDLKGFSNVALTGSAALSRLRVLNGVGNAVAQNTVATGSDDIEGGIELIQGSLLALTALVLGTGNEAIAFIVYAKRKAS